MSTRDQIVAELDRMSEQELEMVLASIRHLLNTSSEQEGLLERLQRIRIDGPPDFASRVDDYLREPPADTE
ncbi:MAG: hypothetical protein AAF624_12220 [Bacteroidota bacterium]